MRIVAGKYRGKILFPPKDKTIRPTTDKVKQALFTKLQFDIQDAVVLDLFTGSGALGVEALSRGASKVYFVDKSKINLSIAKKNVESLNESGVFLCCDYEKALLSLKEKFDLIILDPPYASDYYERALELIYKNNLLKENGIIVCEHDNTVSISQTYFEIFDNKRYGDIHLTYLQIKE